MLRLFHLADYHFGIEFESHNASLRRYLRRQMRQALIDLVDRAIREKIDAVLIAGDLLDDSSIDPRNEIFLIQQLHRLAEHAIDVFLVQGNHDVTHQLPLPFVHVLGSQLEVIEKENYRVVGQSFEKQFDLRTVSDLPVFSDDKPTIGLFHSLVVPKITPDNRSSYLVSTVEELEAAGYAYIALGHVHERAHYGSRKQIHYPGSFFPTCRAEVGPRGYLDIKLGETLKVQFIPSTRLSFVRHQISLESGDNFRLRTYERLKQLAAPEQIGLVRLEGFLQPEELSDLPEILELVREEADQLLEFEDQTEMAPLSDITQNPFFTDLLDNFDDKVLRQLENTKLHQQTPQEFRLWYARHKDQVRRRLLESFYKRGSS